MKKHLSKQKQYSQKAFDCIDWYAIEKAAKTLTLRQQILVTKYASVFFAHGDRMYKRGLWENYICPICARRPETANHIITCDDIKSISQYDTSIKKILEFLQKMHTHPSIYEIYEKALINSIPISFTSVICLSETDHI